MYLRFSADDRDSWLFQKNLSEHRDKEVKTGTYGHPTQMRENVAEQETEEKCGKDGYTALSR